MAELRIPEPSEKQCLFMADRHKYIGYGGARGGGKSWAVRVKAVLLCLRYAGIKVMIIRKTYPELQENHIIPLCEMLGCYADGSERIASYNDGKKHIVFPNGSRILFRYCDNDKDALRFQGTEVDVLFVDEATQQSEEKMEKLRVADAITEIFNIFRRSNKYIDETTPWTLAKDEEKKDRLATVLYNLTEAITIGASLLSSFMPETSEKILAQLNTEKRTLEAMDQFGLYPNGNKVTEKPEILFARMDVKEVLEKVEAMKAEEAKAAGEEENAQEESVVDVEKKPEITYDDFAKLQFQIGQIVKCEEVPKSKKLLCSQVKIGSETRQIISGIKAWYKPDQMVGKKVMVVTNLKPAKLAGMLSEGMILCAEDDEGNLALMTPEKDIKPGSEVC